MTQALTGKNFQDEVLNSQVPVLVDFWAEWCGPCRMISPAIEELNALADDKFKVGKVNADGEAELLTRYRVSALPTLLIFNRGEVVRTLVGVQSKAALLKALQEAA